MTEIGFMLGVGYMLTGFYCLTSALFPPRYSAAIEYIMCIHPAASILGTVLWPLVLLLALVLTDYRP